MLCTSLAGMSFTGDAFNTLTKRKHFIENLNKYVNENFTANYNLFVFGSFLTEDFLPGKSDLDLAIYTDQDIMELDFVVQDFLSNYSLQCDTILIKPDFDNNFIDINVLTGYRCTDWFPKRLKAFSSFNI